MEYGLPDISTEGISQMKLASVQQEATTSVMKNAMDQSEMQASMLTQMMGQITQTQELSLNPNLGGNVNIRF